MPPLSTRPVRVPIADVGRVGVGPWDPPGNARGSEAESEAVVGLGFDGSLACESLPDVFLLDGGLE